MKLVRFVVAVAAFCVLISSSIACAENLKVVDAAGREVVLKGKAERVVTTFKPVTLCALALGLNDRLVGVDTTSRKDGLQQAVYPGIAELADVGRKMTGLNFETLLALRPDVVFMYAQKDGVKTAERLTEAGIPAVVVLPETFDTLKDTLKLMARAVGEPGLAERPVAAIDRVLGMARERVGDKPREDRRRVYFSSALGFFSTASGSMLMNDIVEAAGGTMVSRDLKGYFQTISPETFIKWDPELVTVNSRSIGLAKETLARPEFGQVAAVRSGSLYAFPANIAPWDFPSPLTALSVLWMGQVLYPEAFADVDVAAEVDSFHQTLFGKTFTSLGGVMTQRITLD